jgi:hypothetical protein
MTMRFLKANHINVTVLGTGFVLFLTGYQCICTAQDRHFTWTYESTTLPKGAIDIEPWVSYYTGRENYYNRYETRLEFETGLTDKLQTALYLNSKHITEALIDSSGNITGLAGNSGYSFSNEWKLSILNPSIAPVGLGLYFEYGISTGEIELEFKLLFEKRSQKSIIAYNLVSETEFEYEFEEEENGETEIEREKEYTLENDLAYMYMIKPSLGIGMEARNLNEFNNSELEHSILSIGPTLFYSRGKFFAIVSLLPQLADLKQDGPDLEDHEKLAGRIILGIGL